MNSKLFGWTAKEERAPADSLSGAVSSRHHSSASSKFRAASKRRRYSFVSASDRFSVGALKLAVASLAAFIPAVIFVDGVGVGLDSCILARVSCRSSLPWKGGGCESSK